MLRAFAAYGEATRVVIITDRETGRSRGFGFVNMGAEEGAQAAIAGLNGSELGGNTVRVKKARPRWRKDR